MLGVVELLWLTLTLFVGSINFITLVQPNWIINPFTSACFGPLTFCYVHRLHSSVDIQDRICSFHDVYYIYADYPSLTWQFTSLIYTIATMLMLTSAIVALFAVLLLSMDTRHQIAFAASYYQGFSGKFCLLW